MAWLKPCPSKSNVSADQIKALLIGGYILDVLAASVEAKSAGLHIRLKDGQEFEVPYAEWPSLAAATPQQRTNFRVMGGGDGIHWPDLDEDLSIRGLYRDFAVHAKSRLESAA